MIGIIEDEITTIPGGGEIIPPESKSAELFVPNGLDKILTEVRKRVEQHQPDVSTEKGRKAIASLARWVSNQKSTVEEYGKKRSMAIKIQAVDIDAERKRGKEAFDALRDQARKPLTDYEEAIKARVEAHELALKEVAELSNPSFGADVAEIERRLAKLDEFALRNWEEFSDRFSLANDAVSMRLGHLLRETKQQEEQRIAFAKSEADRVAREAKEREELRVKEQAERDERIAREATERAERVTQERETQSKRDTEAAEARAAKAEQDAKDAALRATEAEKKRAADAKAAEDAATAAREKNKAHKDKINSEAVHAIELVCKISEAVASRIIVAIEQGHIPSVKMLY